MLAAGVIYAWEKFKHTSWFPSGDTVTNHNMVVTEIKALGKLELVQYNFRDVVEHQVQKPLLFPNAKALLIVQGLAVGCIDLSKIKASDLASTDDTLVVHLPEPEICSFKIDHSKSKVYNTEYAFLDEAELINDAFKQAESQIAQSAKDMGILEQTKTNAEKMLRPLLEKISGKKVYLRYTLKTDGRVIDK
jgi:hypothetical protein